MADTVILTNDALTRKRWAKDLYKITMPAVEFAYLTGTSENAPCQINTELAKGTGDNITFGIFLPLRGEGVVGRSTVEGNEEALAWTDFMVTIEELNHAVDSGMAMEAQRFPYDLAVKGRNGLKIWWSQKMSVILINYLCGNSGFKVAGVTFAQAATEPTTYHHLFANNAASEAALAAGDILDFYMLDAAKERAQTMYLAAGYDTAEEGAAQGYYTVRPILIGNKEYYRVILHDYVFNQLRRNFNEGEWGNMKQAAKELGIPDVEIEYNGMLLTKSTRIYNPITNVFRNVLVGAQALTWAWGGAGDNKETVMKFHPYTGDAGRKQLFRAEGIFGVKKVLFNSVDYGVIALSSYATAMAS